MEHQFKFKDKLIEEEKITKLYEGYGYLLKAILYPEREVQKRKIRLRPIQYKNEFHHNFTLDYQVDFSYVIRASSIMAMDSEIDEIAEGFQIAKLIRDEIEERKEELFA